jgi:hypothetical protein
MIMPYKSVTVGSIGVMTQLLENMVSMYTIYADANIQEKIPSQDNGINCLSYEFTLAMLLLIVPGLWDIQ